MHGRGGQSNQSHETKLRAGALIGVCCAALLGCGGAAPGAGADSGVAPSCTPFVACGGDLTGTWKIANICLTPEGTKGLEDSLKLCDADSTKVVSEKVGGTLTYDGHGAVKYDLVGEIAVSQSFPTSCLPPGQDCPANLATLVQAGTRTSAATPPPRGATARTRSRSRRSNRTATSPKVRPSRRPIRPTAP